MHNHAQHHPPKKPRHVQSENFKSQNKNPSELYQTWQRRCARLTNKQLCGPGAAQHSGLNSPKATNTFQLWLLIGSENEDFLTTCHISDR